MKKNLFSKFLHSVTNSTLLRRNIQFVANWLNPSRHYSTLNDAPLSQLVTTFQQNQVQNVIVLSGAGISVAAGLPDFRTPGYFSNCFQRIQFYI